MILIKKNLIFQLILKLLKIKFILLIYMILNKDNLYKLCNKFFLMILITKQKNNNLFIMENY